MTSSLWGKAAIVGIGETAVGKLPGVTSEQLQAEAAVKAIRDAGLKPAEIDAVFSQSPYSQPMLMHSALALEYLGLKPNYTSSIDAGGASPAAMVIYAASLIAHGLINHALCVYGENSASYRTGVGNRPGFLLGNEEFENPFGVAFQVTPYALVAQRHMAVYGTQPEHLAAVAISARKHALLNDNAQMKKPLTLEDYYNSRLISAPLRLFDCSLISDGGGAVVVTSAERARDRPRPPVYLLGAGGKHTHKMISQAPTLTDERSADSIQAAMRQAGVTVDAIDVAELYDCFTITTLTQLEGMGVCQPGESGPYAAEGKLDLGGPLPVNTHGGLLSQAHIDGMLHITEAVKQLRGDCGPRQVEGAEVALVTGNGGIVATHYTLVLGTAPGAS